jgi:glycosyltransferase involved in cell wall biosynthesis
MALNDSLAGAVTVALLGARMHYAAPKAFHAAGWLHRLYTDICAVRGWPKLLRFLPERLRSDGVKRLLGRVPDGIPAERIVAFTQFGWEYAKRRRSASSASEAAAIHLWASRVFCNKIISLSKSPPRYLYALNRASLEILSYCKEKGSHTILEQTSAPKRLEHQLLAKEYDTFPGWEDAPQEDTFVREFMAREAAEWSLADVILCPSEFVLKSVAEAGAPVDRCVLVPYGIPAAFSQADRKDRKGPIRVLTVGAVCLQKGCGYVCKAAELLGRDAQFRVVGPIRVSNYAVGQLRSVVDLVGPVPRTEIRSHYSWADVFLLPSICEGSALVTYEALASGLPVVCTPNTGSVVADGHNGFIVPVRDSGAIAARIAQLARDRDLLHQMSLNAAASSRNLALEAYGRRLCSAIARA